MILNSSDIEITRLDIHALTAKDGVKVNKKLQEFLIDASADRTKDEFSDDEGDISQ